MTLIRSPLFWCTGILLSGILGLYGILSRQTVKPSATPQTIATQGVITSGKQNSYAQDGYLQSSVSAEKMVFQQAPDGKKYYQHPHMALFSRANQPLHIDAQWGESQQHDQFFTLKNNVQIDQTADTQHTATHLRTAILHYHVGKQQAWNDDLVTLNKPEFTTSGVGLRTNFQQQQLQLLHNVQSDYQITPVALQTPAPERHATQTQPAQSYHITADSLFADGKQNTITYTGHVHVQQNQDHSELQADKLVITLSRTRQQLQGFVATGHPAHYSLPPTTTQPALHASALQIKFDPEKNKLLLSHQAIIQQGANEIRNETLWLDAEKRSLFAPTTAEQAVHMVITPDQFKISKTAE